MMRTAAKTTQDTMNNIEIAEPPAKTPRNRKLPASPAVAQVQTVAIEPAPAQALPAARAVRTPKTAKTDPVKEIAAEPAIKAGWKGMNDDEPKLPKPAAPKTADTPPASTPKPKPEKNPVKTPPATSASPAAAVAPATSASLEAKTAPAPKAAPAIKSKASTAAIVDTKDAVAPPLEPQGAAGQSRRGTHSRPEPAAAPNTVKEKAVGTATPGVAKGKPATVTSTAAAKEKPATVVAAGPVKEKPAPAASPAVALKTTPTPEPAMAPVAKPSPKAVVKKPSARPSSAKARIASVVAAAVKARAATKPQRAAAPVKAAAEKVIAPLPAEAVESATAAAPKVVAARTVAPAVRPSVTRQVKQQPAQTGKQKPEPREKAVVQPMLVLESGHLWRMTGIHAVAYVRRASDACAILRTAPGQLADRAMAVYRDKQGRAIAWQVRFETARWAEVEGMLNMPHVKGREEFMEPAAL